MLIISNQNFVHFIFFSIIHKQPDLNALVGFPGPTTWKKKTSLRSIISDNVV